MIMFKYSKFNNVLELAKINNRFCNKKIIWYDMVDNIQPI